MKEEALISIRAEDNFSKAFDKLNDSMGRVPSMIGGINNAVDGFSAKSSSAAKSFGEGISSALNAMKSVESQMPGLSAGLDDVFTSLVDGTASAQSVMEDMLTNLAAEIPVIGGLLSGLIDNLIETPQERQEARLQQLGQLQRSIANQNAYEEAELKYSMSRDERALSEELHELRIQNIKEEMEVQRRMGEDISSYKVRLIEEEARFREAKLREEQRLIEDFERRKEQRRREEHSFSMDNYSFLSSLELGGFDDTKNKIDFLKGRLSSLKSEYSLGNIVSMDYSAYSSLDDNQKSALTQARELLMQINELGSDGISSSGTGRRSIQSVSEYEPVATAGSGIAGGANVNYNVSVHADFSGAFISQSPQDFYENKMEELVRSTIRDESIAYGV